MTIAGFLAYLQGLGVALWLDGEQLAYRAPKGTLTPDLRSELAARKTEIVAFLQLAAMATGAGAETIQPAPRPQEVPLSFAQQRLWFLDQLVPGNSAYHLPVTMRLIGALDVAALERALAIVVERHEALRTTFPAIAGRPVQRVAPTLAVPLVQHDLLALPPPVRDAAIQQYIADYEGQPFDLARGPLLRAGILRRADDEHILLLVLHHIIGDGWSLRVLVREWLAAYRVVQGDASAALPPLPIQYADFAIWQRRWLEQPAADGRSPLQRQLDYWQQQLAGAPPSLNLPADYARPRAQTFRGGHHAFTIPQQVYTTLQQLSREAEATLFMTLLAAFTVLLARYSGQYDISVGTAIAGRTHPELEPLIGFFVNTLVLRTDLSSNPTFRELLARVREVCLGAYAHQDIPFERLVETLQVDRDLSRTPLFQAVFLLETAQTQPIELPGLAAGPLDVSSSTADTHGVIEHNADFVAQSATAKFDLTLALEESPAGLRAGLEYNADLFAHTTIQRMGTHFAQLLDALVANPDQRIQQIPLFAAELAAELGLPLTRITQLAPLTTTQRDLYLDTLIHPDSTTYSLGISVDLGSELDGARWEQAVRMLLDQEAIAKTRFGRYRDELVQWVDPQAPDHFAFIDLSGDSRSDALESTIQALSKRPYDLHAAPLLHSYLIRTPEGRYVALVAAPHILLDAASTALLFQRIGEVYLALGQGQNAAPARRSSFTAYIGEHLAQFDTPAVRRYWAERLKQLPAPEVVPDLQRPARRTLQTLLLAHDRLPAIRAYCAAQPCGLAAFFRALYGLLLHRSGDPPTAFVIYDVRGRRPSAFQQTLGCFYYVLPLLLPPELLGPSAAVAGYLGYVRDYRKALGPLHYLSVFWQRTLMPAESLRFFYNFYDFALAEVAGQQVPLEVHDSFPADEVHLIVRDLGAALELTLHSNELLFKDTHFLERLVAIADQLLQGATRLGDLDILLAAERRQLQLASQGPVVPRPERCLQHFFERQAARTPDAVAVVFDRPMTNDQRPTTNDEGDKQTRRQADEDHVTRNTQHATDNGQRTTDNLHPFTPSPVHPFGSQCLTYHELNTRANQLAHYLRIHGVGPDVVVGICAERSLELVIGLYGILKAGGAYLPLDPTYPVERLALMLDELRPPVLLTATNDHRPPTNDQRPTTNDQRQADKQTSRQADKQRDLSAIGYRLSADRAETQHSTLNTQNSKLLLHPPSSILDLVADWPTIAQQPTACPERRGGSGNLAYIIYTSGSTGQPKGVMIPHHGIVNRLLWMQEAYQLTSDDTVLHKTPFSFDVSVWEFFWPLLAGARLVLARPEGHKDSAYLVELINAERITTLHFVPAMLRVFLEEPGACTCTTLRQVICSGEALPYDLQVRFYDCLRGQLHNLYGPTEASVDVTYWGCEPASAPGVVPIGRPIANSQIYILDSHLRQLPLEVAGHLYIGGVGLARGYATQPSLTAERFVPNPFPDFRLGDPTIYNLQSTIYNGQRLYKTGDLARYRRDGSIEFLGRIDQQVKIRGFRIELSEIETVLAQHPQVQAAVVLAREDRPGEKRLVAYVIPTIEDRRLKIEDSQAGAPEMLSSILHPPSSELRAFLKTRLPEYMVPATFVPLSALPLSPNGKVDRKALPAPGSARPEDAQAMVPPRDDLEQALTQLWEELLEIRPIGVADNFFTLGGHSLLAVQMLARAHTLTDQLIPLSALLQNPTIAHLAALVRRPAAAGAWSPIVGLHQQGSRPPFFCVHPVGGAVLCYRELAEQLGPDQPFYAIQARGLEAGQTPHTSIEAMATDYLDALQAIQPLGPYRLGGWSLGGVVAVEMARQLDRRGQEVAALILLDSWAPPVQPEPFALEPADVLRAFIGDLAGQARQALLIETAPDPQQDAEALLAELLERAHALGLWPPDIDVSQVRRMLAIYTANMHALARYQPQPYPQHLTLLRAGVDSDQIADSTLGWSRLAGNVECYIVPGDHFSMLHAPAVEVLAERLRICLDRAGQHSPNSPLLAL